jgi:signal transduction histidine kinase
VRDRTTVSNDKGQDHLPFLSGGGEMGSLIRNFDWSKTSLGDPEHWPHSLSITLGNVLSSGFPMFLFWGDELTCFYNDAFRPSLGVEGKHPALGKKGEEVWPEIWSFIGPLIDGVISSGKPVWFENQLVPFYRNGKIEDIYWTFSYSRVLDDRGDPGGVLVTCMETTQTVLSQRKTEESEQLLRNLILEAPIGLCLIDADTLVAEIVNDSFIEVAGRPREAIVGRMYWDAFAEARVYYEAALQGVIDTGEPFYANEVPLTLIRHGKPEDVYVTFVYQPIKRVEGMVNKVLISVVENTQLVKRLVRMNEELNQFAYAASHDLQEPLRKIQVFSDRLLYLGKLPPQSVDMAKKIHQSAERMTMLIRSLLEFSQFVRPEESFSSVELNSVIGDVKKDLEFDILASEAIIDYQDLPVIRGSEMQMRQLFQNLLSNSLKYVALGDQPKVRINSSVVSSEELQKYVSGPKGNIDYFCISVKDNGIGFEKQYAEHIFEIFKRLHGRAEYKGSGIGLALCKRIVVNHNGFIHAESEVGKGSTFRIFLPKDD